MHFCYGKGMKVGELFKSEDTLKEVMILSI